MLTISRSENLEQIKNLNHRNALAKLRAGNHNLRIEYREDTAFQRYPKSYECVNTAPPMKLNIKFILFCIAIALETLDNNLHVLSFQMTMTKLFFYICKKSCSFTFEGLQI